MTQALNYTPKAIADLMEYHRIDDLPADDRRGVRFIIDLLHRAEVFNLSDGGNILDRAKPRPLVPVSAYHPPFPVIAIEYPAAPKMWDDPLYSSITSSRRIALAWDWDGRGPAGELDPDFKGVAIAPVCYFDHLGRWLPPYLVPLVAYDSGYSAPNSEGFDSDFRRRIIAAGRISKAVAEAPQMQVAQLLAIQPDLFGRTAAQHGMAQALNFAAADYMDEANTFFDLCLALACTNVTAERHPAPAALNKQRNKSGKLPLRDFHVLKIGGDRGDGGQLGGAHGGVRSHLRRGHIRRLSPERITWVNSCMVRGSAPGFAAKTYSVEPLQ